jgi:transposase
VRTWSPRGQTPVLPRNPHLGFQYHFNWKTLSAIAGITFCNFYPRAGTDRFRLYPGAVRGPQVVNFLRHLSRHLRGKLLVIWDGLPSHRSRLVNEYLEKQAGRIVIEWLPAYAPELNPVEFLWGYWKNHELPNLCPQDYFALGYHARAALRRMRRRPTLVTAFWKQARLLE